MQQTIRVILVIAVVATLITLSYLTVDHLMPRQFTFSPEPNRIERASLLWRVQWFAGLAVTACGLVLRTRIERVGSALLISGVFLMLLGNVSDSWLGVDVAPRIVTAVITLAGMLTMLGRERWINGAAAVRQPR